MRSNQADPYSYKESKWYRKWVELTLRKKFSLFFALIGLIVVVSLIFNVYVVYSSYRNYHNILAENKKCQVFQDAIHQETILFKDYMQHPEQNKRNNLNTQIQKTERAIEALSFEYNQIGSARYAKTWAIRQAYQEYVFQRNYVMRLVRTVPYFVSELYIAYTMQEYLQSYSISLTELTLEHGNATYNKKASFFFSLPVLMAIVFLIIFSASFNLGRLIIDSIMDPILQLVRVSKSIEDPKFHPEEIVVENQDEIGELVQAFNKMQYSVQTNLSNLEEKMIMSKALYTHRIEKMEIQQKLENMKFELLKSQVNPHFLFNTLNMIACMAQVEEAETTEQMTRSLSNLFRYNLKETESMVPLFKELKIVEDYMYIQQMRFSDRVKYFCECNVDPLATRVPSHMLQPLVENAVVHGISSKEEGGNIILRITEEQEYIKISLADSGVGLEKEALEELRHSLEKEDTAKVGIGLGNIYRRLKIMYPKGAIRLYSKQGHGFCIQMELTKEEEEDAEAVNCR